MQHVSEIIEMRIAENRARKAQAMAFLAWSSEIKATDVVTMNEGQWAMLAKAAHVGDSRVGHTVPSRETQALTVAHLLELEQHGAKAA